MAKVSRAAAVPPADKIERWTITTDYVETCNCDFGCPCNFSGYPTGGFCEAIVGYHIRAGRYGKTKLDGLRWGGMFMWPGPIHEGNGTAMVVVDQSATPEQ